MLKQFIYIIAVVGSMVFGIIAGLLFYLGFLANIMYSVVATLIISIVILLLFVLFIGFVYFNYEDKLSNCISSYGSLLLISILGSITSSLLLTLIVVKPTDLLVVSLIGVNSFFFLLECITFILTTICTLDCFRKYND